MAQEKKIFEPISEEKKKEFAEALCKLAVENCRREKIGDHFYRYDVKIQNIKFVASLTDDELKESASLALDALEELKSINNGGIDGEAFVKWEQEAAEKYKDTDGKEFMEMLYVANKLMSKRISEIIIELERVRRVGGAYAAFISSPTIRNGIYTVFDRLVDQFDDDDLYFQSGYFLLRVIMHMNCTEYD